MVALSLGTREVDFDCREHPLLTARTPAQALVQFRLLGINSKDGCPGKVAHLVGMFHNQRCCRHFEGLAEGQTFRHIYLQALDLPPISPEERRALQLFGECQQLVHRLIGIPLLG